MKIDLRKIYRFEPIARNPDGSLPSGGDIYYECAGCNGVVSSVPHIVSQCACGNLSGKGGKVDIKSPDQVNPVRGKLK
jgi:hypothetical protein